MRLTKKIIAIMCCVVFVLGLAGCTNAKDEDEDSEIQILTEYRSMNVYTYVDKETGVNYLIYDGAYAGGICPRYNADGSLYIRRRQR